MKMRHDDFEQLRSGIKAVMDDYPESRGNYIKAGRTDRRWRWDLFHAACDRKLVNSYSLYCYLNDDHIDTALRSITDTK